jgi:hypothetical protein
MALPADRSEKNVVFLGVSISQWLIILPVAISLLVLMAVLWMNHRIPIAARPIFVAVQTGVLCPVQSVSPRLGVFTPQLAARAPPTFPDPSIVTPLEATALEIALVDSPAFRPVSDSAEAFR